MSASRPQFSLTVQLYVVSFFLLLAGVPILLRSVVERMMGGPGFWITAVLWPLVIAVFWFYADRRCSSERLGFKDGLLWVAGSMTAGWVYLSFVLVFPALLVVFFLSVLIAIVGDLRRSPTYPKATWSKMVHFFYRNRMRQ